MKRILIILFFLAALTAAEPVPSTHNLPYTNVEQTVTAELAGDGEAFVTTTLTVDYKENGSLESLTITNVPDDADVHAAVQSVQRRVCVDHERTCVDRSDTGTCVKYDWNGNCVTANDCVAYNRTCTRYEIQGRPSYEDVDVDRAGTTAEIALAEPIDRGTKSTIYLFYTTDRFAEQGLLGKRSYTVQSLGVPIRSSELQIAATADQRFTMSDGSSDVDYQHESLANMVQGGVAQAETDQVYRDLRRIRHRTGGHSETFSRLDADETAAITGAYATSWLRLNWWKLLLGLAVFGTILTGVVVLFRKAITMVSTDESHPYLLAVLAGFVLAFVTVALWIGGFVLSNLLGEALFGGELITAVLFLLIGLLTLVLHIVTPILVTRRENLVAGLLTAVFAIVWLIGFVILTFIIYAALRDAALHQL